ncbi:MAG: chemotaxis protein CheR [Proteobacteria bacterium]|nr:chemotaxis protein CheR [Pseudomonadota bacterium]
MKLSQSDFRDLGNFIHSRMGIKMPDIKRGMIESRLRKRVSQLGMDSYSEYCRYLFSHQGMDDELSHFIDVITTNKTDFFRESHHFEYLLSTALPDLVSRNGTGVVRKLMAWSSACSRGDEPYTLAMILSEYARVQPGFDFSILATDISTKVLDTALAGIYDAQLINPVPMEFRKRYLLKSKDKTKNLVRIRPELRRKIMFRQLNLMDNDFRIRQNMDILFCRNVIIYFDKPTTERLLVKLCNKLVPGGYLFMGHSELLDCNLLPVVPVAPTIYKRIEA